MSLKYNLHLQDPSGTRIAIYDPFHSQLLWEDNGEEVISSEVGYQRQIVNKTSPETPTSKSVSLKLIKIQMGFACNYSCSYCSQNNQRSFQKDTAQQTLVKASGFLSKMEHWFDGGHDKKGSGVHLEFWGGETLLYWDAVEKMARELRQKYPNIGLGLFTNGSLITKEMAEIAAEIRLHFVVSHDGPTFSEDRAKDPFDIPSQCENLKYLFNRLNPLGLISFNATISPKNYSLLDIRKFIAKKLEVDAKVVIITHDLATPYDSAGLNYVTNSEKRTNLINGIFSEMLKQYPFDLKVGMVDRFIHDFFESLRINRNGDTVGQKCQMDLPTSIAVDIDGNILTCQNVTAKGGHKIGHVDQLHEASLNTAYHWSHRKECVQCPVVQICKGACMFLTDNLWEAACDQHFTWGLAYLSLAIFLQTNRYLIKIDGATIRRPGETSIDIIRCETQISGA